MMDKMLNSELQNLSPRTDGRFHGDYVHFLFAICGVILMSGWTTEAAGSEWYELFCVEADCLWRCWTCGLRGWPAEATAHVSSHFLFGSLRSNAITDSLLKLLWGTFILCWCWVPLWTRVVLSLSPFRKHTLFHYIRGLAVCSAWFQCRTIFSFAFEGHIDASVIKAVKSSPRQL